MVWITVACRLVLQCRSRQIAGIRQTSQEPFATEDRVGRQKFLPRICLFLPIQRQSSARACQTTTGGVCPVLCALIIQYASCDIFMFRKGRFLAVWQPYRRTCRMVVQKIPSNLIIARYLFSDSSVSFSQ